MTNWTINYTVSAHGQLNYFKLISGPAADAEMVMRKLAQCHMKPATYDGKPVDVRYQMKVVVDIGMSVTP